MTIQQAPIPPRGVYAATLTFFHPDGSLDLDTLSHHIIRLANAGIAGIVALGSNGEAPHLSRDERNSVVVTIRQTLDNQGFGDFPVIVGASAQSTFETIELCKDAAAAGGSHVLVLPPCYFKAAMTADAIFQFYSTVADASSLPLIVYSFPAVTADIVLDSDLIIRISQHPNVVGTKFTCGDTGKLGRVQRAMASQNKPYWAVGGLADFILPALVSGASGAIAGGANVTPKACVHVYNIFKQGPLQKAMQAQSMLAEGDWVHTGAGIGGTKAALQNFFSYGGVPRSPLTLPSETGVSSMASRMAELIQFENTL